MPIGIGTGLAISAGAGLAGAAISSHSVSSAADKQAAATSQALNLQQQMYQQTRQDLSPYASIGTSALGNLRQLTGMPAAAPTPQGTPGPNPGQVNFSSPQAPLTTPQGGIVPLQQSNGPQNSSSFVMMRAPDGSMNQVDPAHVGYYQQLGAQVVQNGSGFSQPQAQPRMS